MKRIAIAVLAAGALLGQTRSRLGEYALVLDDAPVAERIRSRTAMRSEAAQAHLTKIRTAQRFVVGELTRRKIAVTATGQLLVNAVFVRATPEAAADLKSIPGVKRVQYLPPVKPALTTAVNLINVSAAWAAAGGVGNAGAGIKIGIIDSGIDQNHPGFQDSTLKLPAGFPVGDAGYTNSKVIVARSYVPMIVDHFPDFSRVFDYKAPDDDSPRDRMGHGTAIAMIAAGVPHHSPLGTIAGVAPKAFLGNYKVFGSPGVNDFTLFAAIQAALTDAVQDGMDMVTLSLNEGDPADFGPLDSTACNDVACDVRAQAVENATSMGVLVVAAAGNGGTAGLRYPSLNSMDTPGTAPSAVTVGATQNSHKLYQSVKVNGSGVPSNLQRINALFGDVKVNSPLTAPLRDVAAAGNDGLGCAAMPAGSLSGAIALVQRGTCLFSDKINNAQAAGAVGLIIYQVDGSDDVYSSLYVQNTGIPAVLIGNTDGKALKSYIAANASATATLDPTITAVDNGNVNTIAPFSSRGPSLGNFAVARDFALKPELVAPGSDIYTATQKYDPVGDAYNATGYTTVTGTSYAVGFVAGAAAVAKQTNGKLNTPGRLKSAVVNTATSDVLGGVHVTDVGAGTLNAGDAAAVAATLEPAAISFGPVPAALPITRNLTITNVSGSAINLNLAVRPITGNSKATVSVSSSSVALASGASTQVSVSLGGARPDPGAYEGFIDVTGAGPGLHLPFYYVVGDGLPYNIQCIIDCSFTGSPNDTAWPLAFRVVDQYGVPVTNTPVGFQIKAGGGKIDALGGDTVTDKLGNAEVFMDLGSIQGDQIFFGGAGGLTQEFDGFARRLPSIQAGGVVNAATFALGQGLQPGSYITIFGSDLSDTTAATSTSYLPLSLASVAVSFDGGGITLPGHLHFVSPGQINVQIPWEYEGQSSVNMKVTYAGYLFSSVFPVKLAAASPGSFGILDQSFAVVSPSNAAKRGQVIQIFANGLGPAAGHPASGEPARAVVPCDSNPTVTVGGVSATVQFCGLVAPFVGLYQLNVTVPGGVSAGTQPLVISKGGNSATVNLPVQ
jgi:uncharacterized protein (TIGR03437 family)